MGLLGGMARVAVVSGTATGEWVWLTDSSRLMGGPLRCERSYDSFYYFTPAQAAVFEDALAGVEAGRAGHFGFVVGVDRVGQADALKAHGGEVVVKDLAELLVLQ